MAVVIRIKYLDRNLLLAYYSAKCSPSADWKIEQKTGKKIGWGFEWLLHGSAAAAAKALCTLKGARAAPALGPPSSQGSGGCRWVVENKLPAQPAGLPTLIEGHPGSPTVHGVKEVAATLLRQTWAWDKHTELTCSRLTHYVHQKLWVQKEWQSCAEVSMNTLRITQWTLAPAPSAKNGDLLEILGSC